MCSHLYTEGPQWSPALSAGNGPSCAFGGEWSLFLPQWSPALSAGNGREVFSCRTWVDIPQWSPALSAGNGVQCALADPAHTRRNGAQPYRLGMAAVPGCIPASGFCRNGAQPYRLGMAAGPATRPAPTGRPQWSPALSAGNGHGWLGPCTSKWMPQWSPALSAGNGGRFRRKLQSVVPAAMEPSLIGWEWASTRRSLAIAAAGRNGAQPYRLGMGRNLNTPRCADIAAMEPSLIGWEWQACLLTVRPNIWPQWSPALSAGNGYARSAASSACLKRPQWSPALSAGNGSTLRRLQYVEPYVPQWSPALSAGNGSRVYTFDTDGVEPQWSPALSAGNGTPSQRDFDLEALPQWSPALSAGNGCTRIRQRGCSCRRNGAQPYRLGMVQDHNL